MPEEWLMKVVVVILLTGQIHATRNMTPEAQLVSELFHNYNPVTRPRLDPAQTVDTTFSLFLTRLDEVSMRSEIISVTGWMVVQWRDDLLTWEPADHHNITDFLIPTSHLWIPVIALDNSVTRIVDKTLQDNFKVIVKHTGMMSWEPAGSFSASCETDITFYPFDRQTCTMSFSTWDFTLSKVNLTAASDKVQLDAYVQNGEWTMHSTSVSPGSFQYNSSQDVYPELRVTFRLQRRSLYYFINILIPCLMMSGLVLMVFFLPPDSGEKVSLGVTVLLAFSVFQLMIAADIPTSASATPILEVYLLCFMGASTFSVIVSVLVLNLHHRTEYTPPPKWLRHVVLDCLGHWMCMGTKRRQNVVHPSMSDCEEKVEAKINISDHLDVTGGASAPKIFLPTITGDLTEEPSNTGFLDASHHTLAPAPLSTARLIRSMAALDKCPSSQSKSAFISAVRDVYQELYQSRRAGELEAALENEWKQIARVVDRLFFWVCFALVIVSSGVVFGVVPPHDASKQA